VQKPSKSPPEKKAYWETETGQKKSKLLTILFSAPHFGRWEQLQPRRPAKKMRWKLQAAVGQ
jgi:hypothetical protein